MNVEIKNHFAVRIFSLASTVITPSTWGDQDAHSVFWTLYQNDRDGAFLTVDGTTIPLVAGGNYVIPSNCRYDYRCDRDIRHFFVFFDVLGFSRSATQSLFPLPFRLSAHNDNEMLSVIAERHQSEIEMLAQWEVIAALSEGLRSELAALKPEQLIQGQQMMEDVTPVASALRHIAQNLGDELPNGKLAALCSMSKDYFIRRFRVCTGQTPSKYILDARIKRAAELLLFSETSIDEIAFTLGFGNRAYFSRVFAHQMGLGPASYRKTRHVGNSAPYFAKHSAKSGFLPII